MSILEKFFKNKKEVPEPEKNSVEIKIEHKTNISHASEICSDGKLYKTETAELIVRNPFQFYDANYATAETYFVTPKGNFFSATGYAERHEIKKDDTIIYELNIVYGNLKPEPPELIKRILGNKNIELYKKYFGEVEEA